MVTDGVGWGSGVVHPERANAITATNIETLSFITCIPLDSSQNEAASVPSPQPALSPPAMAGFQSGHRPARRDDARRILGLCRAPPVDGPVERAFCGPCPVRAATTLRYPKAVVDPAYGKPKFAMPPFRGFPAQHAVRTAQSAASPRSGLVHIGLRTPALARRLIEVLTHDTKQQQRASRGDGFVADR